MSEFTTKLNSFLLGGSGRAVLRSRQLENRSFLRFVFPQGGNASPIIFTLPFYENPVIQENKQANLVRYLPIGRPSEFHSYTGAKARRISLEFAITLPHIQFEATALSIDRFLNRSVLESKEHQKREFRNSQKRGELQGPVEEANYGAAPAIIRKVQRAISQFFGEEQNQGLQIEGLDFESATYANTEAAVVIYWWISLIRSSVLNNSQNPLLGPPIIRLTHGLLYNNVPFVNTSYDIVIDETAGYDLYTLLPRRILISLVLEEVRSSETFEPNSIKSGDSIVGWEAILEHGTIDPGEDNAVE